MARRRLRLSPRGSVLPPKDGVIGQPQLLTYLVSIGILAGHSRQTLRRQQHERIHHRLDRVYSTAKAERRAVLAASARRSPAGVKSTRCTQQKTARRPSLRCFTVLVAVEAARASPLSAPDPCRPGLACLKMTQTGPAESVATLDRVPRLEDHVTLGELGRIDEARGRSGCGSFECVITYWRQ
jgi:hypothetical protein